MGKSLVVFGLAVAVLVMGCSSKTRDNYLEPETQNAFWKNVGRASIVLSPIGFGTTVLVSEIRKDLEQNGPGARKKEGVVQKQKDAQTGKEHEYYVVERIDVSGKRVTSLEPSVPDAERPMVASRNSYFIVDGEQELDLKATR